MRLVFPMRRLEWSTPRSCEQVIQLVDVYLITVTRAGLPAASGEGGEIRSSLVVGGENAIVYGVGPLESFRTSPHVAAAGRAAGEHELWIAGRRWLAMSRADAGSPCTTTRHGRKIGRWKICCAPPEPARLQPEKSKLHNFPNLILVRKPGAVTSPCGRLLARSVESPSRVAATESRRYTERAHI